MKFQSEYAVQLVSRLWWLVRINSVLRDQQPPFLGIFRPVCLRIRRDCKRFEKYEFWCGDCRCRVPSWFPLRFGSRRCRTSGDRIVRRVVHCHSGFGPGAGAVDDASHETAVSDGDCRDLVFRQLSRCFERCRRKLELNERPPDPSLQD